MNHTKLVSQIVISTLIILLSVGCSGSQPAPTLTPVPPTAAIVPTVAATLSSEQIASLNPSPRGYVSMAYDVESDRVILFGGQTGNISDPAAYNGETWAYDLVANKWTEMKPTSGPTRRGAPELAYDIESDRVILFGGCNEVLWGLNDTWAYDFNTNTWAEMAKGLVQHAGDRIAHDAESDRIILFGGYAHNDTWAYDFNSDTWTEMKPSNSPVGRNFHTMTYDSKSDRIIMMGGDIYLQMPDDSVWLYDFNTNTWTEMKPGNGEYRLGLSYSAIAYDVESDWTIFFGDPIGDDDTWAYDSTTNTWEKLVSSTVPSVQALHAMVYNSAADRVVLFGGQVGYKVFDYSGETWTYDLNTNTWTNVTPHP